MYGGKAHVQECIFQQSRPPKEKNFHSAPTMVGPPVVTKPWNFYSPETLAFLP